MSKVARLGVVILFVLVVCSAGVAIWALLQKKTLEEQNQNLQNQISQDQTKESQILSQAKKLQDDMQSLNNKVAAAQREKSDIQNNFDELKQKSDSLQDQIDQANKERDDWKSQVDTLRHDRDQLMEKLRKKPKVIYRERTVTAAAPKPAETAAPQPPVASASGDDYWAGVLRQKAALQLELEKTKADLDQAALQVVGLKKENSDLELEIKKVNNDKDEIEQKIKYGEDLANSLSIDLARSRNDQKAVNDRADKLKDENLDLQSQIKDLSSTKLALEKTISRLTDEKDDMQKKLVETESVIQNRIDDIWRIKDSLDKKLSENAPPQASNGNVELPPIIVNSGNQGGGQSAQMSAAPASAKNQGAVISINESNNFVITDLGQENSPVTVGNVLRAYRGSQQIATLEVIQVRRDISAADIKDSSSPLKVGDIVKFN